MVIKDKVAYNMMITARTTLLIQNGFFGFLALQLKIKENYDIPTAAVDGKSIFYNPNFVKQLTEDELMFLWAHEVMHCCFQHFARRGSRDPQAWNIAGDFVINLDLHEAGFTLINNRPIDGKNFKCCVDKKYRGMSTEEVYDTFPTMKVLLQGLGLGNNEDPGGCGGIMDAPSTKGDDTKHEWEVAVRAAVQVAAGNNAGKMPASLKNLLVQLNKPKVSWRDQTLRFIDQSTSKEISWSRINRRSTALGTLLPGYISDRLSKLVCFIDTSGSVSRKMAMEMLSEVNGAMDQGVADMVVVAYADTQVSHVDEYNQGDVITLAQYTGGGTDFRDSFEWLKKNHPDASCVIYLTDLCVDQFGEDPGCPVMWAVFSPYSSFKPLADRTPFGNSVHVSESG